MQPNRASAPHAGPLRVSDAGAIAQVTAMASASGYAHTVPLLEAARSGLIQLVVVPRQAHWPKRQLKRCTKPTLILLGDDDYQSSGPQGWASAQEARDWCVRAMLHGSGGNGGTYRKALYDCLEARRYVLVETSSAQMEAWTTLFAAAPIKLDL